MKRSKDGTRQPSSGAGDVLGFESTEAFEAQMGEFLQRHGLDIDPENLMDRIRISAPVNYGAWADMLEQVVQWPIEDFNGDAEYLHPFGFVPHEPLRIPLYATSLNYRPGDNEDRMAEEILDLIAEQEKTAVLFFRAPLVKVIDGKWFAYYGKLLWNGSWHDFLLNENTKGIAALLTTIQQGLDIERPPVSLEDEEGGLAISAAAALAGYDLSADFPESVRLFGNENWWKTIMVG